MGPVRLIDRAPEELADRQAGSGSFHAQEGELPLFGHEIETLHLHMCTHPDVMCVEPLREKSVTPADPPKCPAAAPTVST